MIFFHSVKGVDESSRRSAMPEILGFTSAEGTHEISCCIPVRTKYEGSRHLCGYQE